jgi:uncharacterized protein (DUF433 family)
MNTASTTSWIHLARKPGSNYRQLFIKDRNISARTLYGQYLDGEDGPGRTVEALAEDFNLPVAAVCEAIAYCKSDPPEIHADWEREEALVEATGMNDPNYKFHPSPRPLSREDYLRIYCDETLPGR